MMRRKTVITELKWKGHQHIPFLVFQVPKHGYCECCGGQGPVPIGTDGVCYYCYYCWYKIGAIGSVVLEMLEKLREEETSRCCEVAARKRLRHKGRRRQSIR